MADQQPVRVSGLEPKGPMRVPRQPNTIGRAGYKGRVDVYEPAAPNVRMAPVEDSPELKEAAPVEDKAVAPPRRRSRNRKKPGTPEATLEGAE